MMMKIYDNEMETTTGWKAFTWNMKVTSWMTLTVVIVFLVMMMITINVNLKYTAEAVSPTCSCVCLLYQRGDEIHFAKVHAPYKVLRRYADILKFRLPMKEVCCMFSPVWCHFDFNPVPLFQLSLLEVVWWYCSCFLVLILIQEWIQ